MKEKMNDISGFTLIELLVVTGIFMLVLIPVLGVFSSSYESYVVQDDVAAAQQNVRAAMTIMEREVRMAGSGMSGFYDIDIGGRVYGLEYENATGPNASDKLVIRYVNPDESECDDGSNSDGLRLCSELPPLSLEASMSPSSSEATVYNNLEEEPGSWWDEECYCGGEQTTQGNSALKAIITSPDGTKSETFYLTHVQPSAGHIQNHPYLGFENKVINEYPPGSTISFFTTDHFITIRYYLNDEGVLIQEKDGDVQPLAEDIEDFQVSVYGDFDGVGGVVIDDTCAGDNEDCRNDVSVTAAENTDLLDDIRIVRIGVLGRTAKPHRELSPTPRPAIEDHDAAAESDYFRRRLLQTEIKVRNLGL